MQSVLSNQLKAVLFRGNIHDDESHANRSSAATLQEYSYSSTRTRDHLGRPYSSPHSTYLEFTLRNFSKEWAKFFLKEMSGNHPTELSFVFNAVFNSRQYLDNSESSFIARGYVTDVKEEFDYFLNDGLNQGQNILYVKMIITRLTYPGSNGNKVLMISND